MVGVYLGPVVNLKLNVKEIIIRPVKDFWKLYICGIPKRREAV